MKFLPLTNLGHKLRPRYRWRITALIAACVCAAFVPVWMFAVTSAHALGLYAQAPLGGEDHARLWMTLFLVVMLGLVGAAYLGSFVLLAGILHWFYGWTWVRTRELIFQARIPRHWFEPGVETQG